MKFFNKLDKGIDFIGCISFACILVFTSSNVVFAWFFDMRYPQIDELVNTFFVWVTYVGAGLLYKNDEHISVDFVVRMLPAKLQHVCDILVDVFSLCISAVMTKLAWQLAAKSFNKTTPVLHIPFTIIDFALVIGFFTLAAYIIVKLIAHIKQLKEGQKNG